MTRSRLFWTALLAGALLTGACSRSDTDAGTGPAAWDPEQIVTADGYTLPYQRWGPDEAPRAVILGLHGLNDYSAGLAMAAERLAAEGIVTYAYDQRSFGATENRGRWPGTDTLVDDAETVLELLAQRYPEHPLYLLGQSMGGGVVMILAAERDPEIDGVILVAPAVWGRRHMPWYQQYALWLTARIAPGWRLTGESLGVRPTDNPEVMRALYNDPLIQRETRADVLEGVTNLMDRALAATGGLTAPALILYGENDQVIPPRPVCGMLRRLPDPPEGRWRLILYPEGYHMLTRDLQRERVHLDIAAWVLDPATPHLPSELETGREAALHRLCPR